MADDDQRTEEERIQAMFQQTDDYWTRQQEQMASAAFVKRPAAQPQIQPIQQPIQQPQIRPQPVQQSMNPAANARPYNPAGGPHASNIPPITQKPPTGYVCFKCGEPGHWIYYCPNYTKLAEDAQKAPRPAFSNSFSDTTSNFDSSAAPRHPPPELVCRLCSRLMREAVLVPCCGKSFCDECTYVWPRAPAEAAVVVDRIPLLPPPCVDIVAPAVAVAGRGFFVFQSAVFWRVRRRRVRLINRVGSDIGAPGGGREGGRAA
ncbi:hypothetical protein BC936DRAFT_143860, partial [Jimgerdemannia flammicorona]